MSLISFPSCHRYRPTIEIAIPKNESTMFSNVIWRESRLSLFRRYPAISTMSVFPRFFEVSSKWSMWVRGEAGTCSPGSRGCLSTKGYRM